MDPYANIVAAVDYTALRYEVRDALTRERQAAENAKADAERQRRDAAKQAEIAQEHEAALATASRLGKAVLELHGPKDVDAWGAHCDGCDAEGMEVEWTPWPCSTYVLVRDHEETRP